MTQQSQPSADSPAVYPAVNYLNADRGVKSWLLTLDHKRIGIMYFASVLVMFLVGGIFAMAVRLELLTPGPTIMGANTYNRMFTLHGIVMIFLFMIPAIPGVFGNFCMPLMLGAKDVAFPRLNLLSLYLYWTGAILAISAIIFGGIDTGWTFYPPYSTTTPMTAFPALVGIFILGFSSIVTGLNFIVTIHTLRAPGMTWMRMQLFVWAIYATSIIQVLATPVIGLTVMLAGIEKVAGFGLFDSAKGGDPVLFQHFFWFYSHPAVYIMVLPSMGVVSDAIAAVARKNVFGYQMIAYSSLGIAFVGFFAWGHHMFVSGQSPFDNGAFAVISMFVGVFTAIKVFNWVGTLYRGAIAINAMFVYICGFLFFVVFGGMTGIAVATISLDIHWHDTYFVVAHFHFIMVGAVIMGFLIAIHYWFPKMFGRMYHEGWAMVSASFIVLGFIATFIPQFLVGNAGMPRRYYMYPERFQAMNVASTAGSSLLAFGFIIIAIYLIYALVRGEIAGDNPWKSMGVEWQTTSPPDKHNFAKPVVITKDPHSYQKPGEEVEHVVI
ncbi:MAG TPA: cbb3-type cytochrome c oxidase subunit I [Polyangia bacterium]|jgi:cytochrome c oxidase subunit 1